MAVAAHNTPAKSLDELLNRIREAIELCLAANQEEEIPPELVGVQHVWIPKN